MKNPRPSETRGVKKEGTTAPTPQVSFRVDATFRARVNAAARFTEQTVGEVLQAAFELWIKEQVPAARHYVEDAGRKIAN